MAFNYREIRITQATVDDEGFVHINGEYGKPADGITLGDEEWGFSFLSTDLAEATELLATEAGVGSADQCAKLIAATILARADTRVAARANFAAVVGDVFRIDIDTRPVNIGEPILRNP